MEWLAVAHLGFHRKSHNARSSLGKLIASFIGLPILQASDFLFKFADACNKVRLRPLCSEEFFLKHVGWVEPLRNPSSPQTAIDGYRYAPPILRAAGRSAITSTNPHKAAIKTNAKIELVGELVSQATAHKKTRMIRATIRRISVAIINANFLAEVDG
jgi:hypothetical protein